MKMNNIKLMDGEVLKDIEGFEGLYQVSNKGRVYSKSGKGRFLKSWGVSGGKDKYQVVGLQKDKKKNDKMIHRLVGFAFVQNDDPKNKTEIHHIDNNPKNNNSENLLWVSPKEHKKIHENKNRNRMKERWEKDLDYINRMNDPEIKKKQILGSIKSNSKPIDQYSKEGRYIKTFDSAVKASNETGIDRSSITLCCSGKYKSSGGFVWKYHQD